MIAGEMVHQQFTAERCDVTILGEADADAFVQKIITILGADYTYEIEADFCARSGCPPDSLEQWLSDSWIQHDLGRIERGEERPGPFPLLLEKPSNGRSYQFRPFSPGPDVGPPPEGRQQVQ
jgi:hypothetical protein